MQERTTLFKPRDSSLLNTYIYVHMFNFYWIQPGGNGGGYDNDGSPKIIVFHLDSSPNMCLVFLTMLFALLPQLELFTDKFSLSLDSIGITNPTKQG